MYELQQLISMFWHGNEYFQLNRAVNLILLWICIFVHMWKQNLNHASFISIDCGQKFGLI